MSNIGDGAGHHGVCSACRPGAETRLGSQAEGGPIAVFIMDHDNPGQERGFLYTLAIRSYLPNREPFGEEVSSEKWRSFDQTEMQVHRLGVALLTAQG